MTLITYRAIPTHFWTLPEVEKLSIWEKLTYLFLLTNTETSSFGIYQISVARAAADIGFPKFLVGWNLRELERHGLVRRSGISRELALRDWILWHNPQNPNQKISVLAGTRRICDPSLIKFVDGLEDVLEEITTELASKTVLEPSPKGSQRGKRRKEERETPVSSPPSSPHPCVLSIRGAVGSGTAPEAGQTTEDFLGWVSKTGREKHQKFAITGEAEALLSKLWALDPLLAIDSWTRFVVLKGNKLNIHQVIESDLPKHLLSTLKSVATIMPTHTPRDLEKDIDPQGTAVLEEICRKLVRPTR